MSLLYSSGDNGDETGGVKGATPSPDFPASSPLVTAVGGTSLGVDASNQRVLELGWETGKETLQSNGKWSAPAYLYGSGGGTSRLFAQPDYQKGVASAISTTNRVVPDVSAVGDPNTGMLVGETQMASDGTVVYDYYRLGGTSLSSPLYAGMLALVEQQVGHEMGLANPALYAAQSVSYDITKTERARVADEQGADTWPGVVRADYVNAEDATDGYVYSVRLLDYDEPLTIHVRTGYDDVTGVGSPDGTAWLNAVAGAATP